MKQMNQKQTECPNCNSPLSSNHHFCPQCGQENHDLNVSFQHLVKEAIENIFEFDSKSLQTIKALVFKPGFLSLEFMHGRRVRYVPPLKLYIFISFFFFFLLSLPAERGKPVRLDFTFLHIKASELQGLKPVQLDSVMKAHNIDQTGLNRSIVHQLARIGGTERSAFLQLLLKVISYMIFVLMPFFALIILLSFKKDAQNFLGTLVFSIHYHSYIFFLLTFFILISRFIGLSSVVLLPFVISPLYLYAAFRRVYNNSFLWTALKLLIIGILQLLMMTVLLILALLIGVLIF